MQFIWLINWLEFDVVNQYGISYTWTASSCPFLVWPKMISVDEIPLYTEFTLTFFLSMSLMLLKFQLHIVASDTIMIPKSFVQFTAEFLVISVKSYSLGPKHH